MSNVLQKEVNEGRTDCSIFAKYPHSIMLC